MAQRTTVVLTDDIDGGKADETIQFGIEGVSYEIDLSDANAEKLRRAVELYIEHGRRVSGRRSSVATAAPAPAATPRATRSDAPDSTAVRAWARGQGIEVSDRGRIKGDVIRQFQEAGN
ncbi:MAG: histone-like nucleoid-structuring protein Lsr2 [Janthinobacterium lividum]